MQIPSGASPKSYETPGAMITLAVYLLHVLVHGDFANSILTIIIVHMNECIHHACCVHTVVVVISLWLLLSGNHAEINTAEHLGKPLCYLAGLGHRKV